MLKGEVWSMLDCRRMKKLLGRYFDDELSPDERLLLEAHLKQCSRCRTELQAIGEIAGAFRKNITIPPVPPHLAQRIMEKARAQVKGPYLLRLFLFWKNWSFSMRCAAVGVAAAACYIGIAIGRDSLSAAPHSEEEMRWITMSHWEPISTAYTGRAR
jgi:anti-sigma factor RsiW